MGKRRVQISDFSFIFQGRGVYNVIYTSPITSKMWKCRTTNMSFIDRTKNAEEPLIKDLEMLKWFCKNT